MDARSSPSCSPTIREIDSRIGRTFGERQGSRLDSMRIYFDTVLRIPRSSQGGEFCIACRPQAMFVELDDDGAPLSYLCDDHVVEARRLQIVTDYTR
ncbi:MAG: hypothetical protein WB662_04105 [Methyloceanibacter sp.]